MKEEFEVLALLDYMVGAMEALEAGNGSLARERLGSGIDYGEQLVEPNPRDEWAREKSMMLDRIQRLKR